MIKMIMLVCVGRIALLAIKLLISILIMFGEWELKYAFLPPGFCFRFNVQNA